MALNVGAAAPDFSLLDATMNTVSLSSLKGKSVVVAFYPAAFTGVCANEVCAIQDNLAKLNAVNATVVGISADTPFANNAFGVANSISFPLLSDLDLATITAYDVRFNDFAGIKGLTRSARAVFVVDPAGVISYVEVTENPGVEPDYAALLAAVEAVS